MKINKGVLLFAVVAAMTELTCLDSIGQALLTTYPTDIAKKNRSGSYFSLTLNQPPFPFNPFPELPLYEAGDGTFVYDDRTVDYVKLRAEIAAMEAERKMMQGESDDLQAGGGSMALMSQSGGLVLNIELIDESAKRVSFNTQPGYIYDIEQSTNLVNWTLLETIVANDTNKAFFSFGNDNRFYRVRESDGLIQFPGWDDFIEQYLNFDVWTSIQGTYHLELYGNGSLLYQTTQTVPANGFFGVYDSNYDPNQWPNTGYYVYNDWELRVTVTPAAAAGGGASPPAEATVNKKTRRRNANRVGVTVQQYNAFSISFLIQDEIDDWMLYYYLAGYQGAFQVALDGSLLNEFIDRTAVPKLLDTNSWTQLKALIYGTNSPISITDMHYFGHGNASAIGSNMPNSKITIGQLTSSILATNPMSYVALDGCRTSKNTDMLRAYVGHGSKVARSVFKDKGWDPRFGWGWKDTKTIAFVNQGTLFDKHFYFVGDYYWFLTQRNPPNGYMLNTFEEAIAFGQRPNPHSQFDLNLTRNTEGDSINYVGCFDCFFDE